MLKIYSHEIVNLVNFVCIKEKVKNLQKKKIRGSKDGFILEARQDPAFDGLLNEYKIHCSKGNLNKFLVFFIFMSIILLFFR